MAVIINENVNRIFEDADFERIYDNVVKRNQMKAQQDRWDWNEFSNVKIQSLDVPVEKQEKGFTYTYIADFDTTKKLLSEIKRILKDSQFDIDNEFNNTDIDPTDDYEPIGKLESKLLTNAGLNAHINNPYKKGNRIYVNLGISSIRVDAPEFYGFYQPNKFIVYLESNILYKVNNGKAKEVVNLANLINLKKYRWSKSELARNEKELEKLKNGLEKDDLADKRRYELITEIRSTIDKIIDDNWVFKDFTLEN